MSIIVSALATWLLFNLAIVIALYVKPLHFRFLQTPKRGTFALVRTRQRTF